MQRAVVPSFMKTLKNRYSQHFETPDALRRDVITLSNDAEALLEATKEVVDEKVKAARKQLADSIERSRNIYNSIQQKAIDSAKYADETIHAHPYHTALLAFGLGAWLGFFCSRRA